MLKLHTCFCLIFLIKGALVTTGLCDQITNTRTRFLVSVSAQLNDCNATVATDYIKPGQNFSTAPVVNVSGCDYGPLMYSIDRNSETKTLKVQVIFGTHLYFGPPPNCYFQWKGGYVNPTAKHMDLSPLAGCQTHVTDKENHTTYLVFQFLTWEWF